MTTKDDTAKRFGWNVGDVVVTKKADKPKPEKPKKP